MTEPARDKGTQMKVAGKRDAATEPKARRAANWSKTPRVASQKSCESMNRSSHAHTDSPTGPAAATRSSTQDGRAAPVRLGTKVKRNPSAKQVITPWICTSAWKMERYSAEAPIARRNQCVTPTQASTPAIGKKRR